MSGTSTQDITDAATDKSRLLSQRCSTCVFRSGNPMHLSPGRLADLLAEALPDSYIVCHQTLTYGPHPEYGPAICRGFYDSFARVSLAIRLLRAFQRIIEVPPPDETVS